MTDIPTLTALAASAVTVISSLLHKAIGKGAEEVGKSAGGSLFSKLKQRLGHAGAKEALDDLAKQPNDADAQAALRVQLRKAGEADSGLVEILKELVAAAKTETTITQTANVHGVNNKPSQIVGNFNSVS